MAKEHSTRRLHVKGTSTERTPNKLSEGQKISHAIIKTTDDLDKFMEQRNIPQIDVEEHISEMLADELEGLEDTVEGDNPDDDDFIEEHDNEEDDYKDYDEIRTDDIFEIEEGEIRSLPKYIATVFFEKELPIIKFSHVPQYDTDNVLVKKALSERYELFHKIASFIAQAQTSFFRTGNESSLGNLNQQDIVQSIKNDGKKLSKVHVSRMLDALYFKIDGLGTVPARFLLRHYGSKSKLTQENKLNYAREFLKTCESGLNQLEKARALVQFIERKENSHINLSDSENEHDKYKQWKKLISNVENKRK